jgi:hypothetical protein
VGDRQLPTGNSNRHHQRVEVAGPVVRLGLNYYPAVRYVLALDLAMSTTAAGNILWNLN